MITRNSGISTDVCHQSALADGVKESIKNSIALTINTPHAGVKGEPDADYNAGSDEFGVVNFKNPPSRSYAIGDPLELIVPHCDPVVNLYDVIYGIRGDIVEEIIPITARGRSQ